VETRWRQLSSLTCRFSFHLPSLKCSMFIRLQKREGSNEQFVLSRSMNEHEPTQLDINFWPNKEAKNRASNPSGSWWNSRRQLHPSSLLEVHKNFIKISFMATPLQKFYLYVLCVCMYVWEGDLTAWKAWGKSPWAS
jgi:hypothetical protein